MGEARRQGLWIVTGSALAPALQNAGPVIGGWHRGGYRCGHPGYLDAVSWGIVPVLGISPCAIYVKDCPDQAGR